MSPVTHFELAPTPHLFIQGALHGLHLQVDTNVLPVSSEQLHRIRREDIGIGQCELQPLSIWTQAESIRIPLIQFQLVKKLVGAIRIVFGPFRLKVWVKER